MVSVETTSTTEEAAARSARPTLWQLIRDYPWLALTLFGLILTLALLVFGASDAAFWIGSGFALVVAAWTAVGMVKTLMGGSLGIDILAVTAIVAAVFVGEYLAALVVCLMLTGGEALEDYAAGRAKRELTALVDRAPVLAHVIAPDGSIQDVPVEDVPTGATVLVRPAEIIPLDGVLLGGTDFEVDIDESTVTGEPLPVAKTAGDKVLSGTVAGPQSFQLQVSATAEDSHYSHILNLVRQAQESQAPMVRLADRYAVPFTLVAYIIGGSAWALSGDPVRFAQVLVVATPCPLLIAAPVAFMAGMSRAANNGIIVKAAGILEKLSRIKVVGFDKTGTLTHGTPEVVRVAPANSFTEDQLLAAAASAEQYSSHVLAESLVQAAQQRGLTLSTASHAEEIATNGVLAQIGQHQVVVGKPAFVAEHVGNFDREEFSAGQAAVYVGVAGVYAGAIVLADQLRENASATVQRLHQDGVTSVMMLTGDVRPTAEAIAAEAGIDLVHAELLPEDKVKLISAASKDEPAMMIGDGINDAPVLASSSVGVAMAARGATAASESADVVIIKDDISAVGAALEIGQDTTRVALESIWLGIAISIGLMIVAAFGVIPVIAGALLQEVVDLVAILNALRALKPRKR
ncbi:heavy metal translocating P-type ATPase [Micrococcoides hystricis]|uniref:Heavy metal translocating P-type ATPase n=1 Tax=Micrococcoides hystricis TaxID=1572761 RepID=A0ABV6P9S9_9MICC